MKKIIESGETVFATGVYLQREPNVMGGWVVMGFEDDTFFDGKLVNTDMEEIDGDGKVIYFTED